MATYSGSVGDEYTPSNSFLPAPQKNGANFYGNWINSNYKWRLTNVDLTNKEAHWDLVDGTTVYQQYGFQIHWDSTNSKNVVRANDDNNTSDPHEFSVGQAQSASDRHINIDTSDGDRLFGYGVNNANDDFDVTWLFGTNGIPLWTTPATVHRTGTFVPPATIYCTDTSHAQYPSYASGYLFARDTSHDVTVGGVITKYAYVLGETTVPQGYPNHIIHLDTATNTWVDGHATNEPDPIEHVPGAYWVRWRHASQSSTTWYYFEDKSSWYSAAGGGGQTHGSGTSQSSSSSTIKVFHNFW